MRVVVAERLDEEVCFRVAMVFPGVASQVRTSDAVKSLLPGLKTLA